MVSQVLVVFSHLVTQTFIGTMHLAEMDPMGTFFNVIGSRIMIGWIALPKI